MTDQRSDSVNPTVEPAASGDPAAIRADIERTRAELGDTVQALAAKTDVKARAQDAAHTAAVRVQDGVAEGLGYVAEEARQVGRTIARRPGPASAAIAGLAAGITALLVYLAQRASRRRAAARRARAQRPWRRLARMLSTRRG